MSSNSDLLGLHELLNVITGNIRQCLSDLWCLLLQLLTQNLLIGLNLVFNTELVFIGSDNDISDVQFFVDIVFERLDVLEILRIGVNDNKLLQWGLKPEG